MRFAFSGHLETKGRGRLRSTEDLIEFSERRACGLQCRSLTDAHLEMMLCTPDAGVVPGAYGAQACLSYEARSL